MNTDKETAQSPKMSGLTYDVEGASAYRLTRKSQV